MSATKKSGVTADPERIAVAKKLSGLAAFLLSNKGEFPAETLPGLNQVLQAVNDRCNFNVEVLKPNSIGEFLLLRYRSQGIFNQLASELWFSILLDQLENTCFLNAGNLAKVKPFIEALYEDKIETNLSRPPKNFCYLPVEEAVEAYRKIFGSSLKADSVIARAKQATARADSEGIAVWLKLSTLARLFGVQGDPLTTTDEGRDSYVKIVEMFIPIEYYTRYDPDIGGDGGVVHLPSVDLTASRMILTEAGIRTWGRLEQTTDDDFCFSPSGGSTGEIYAGHSARRSRVKIVLAGDQFGQDCLMTGGTLRIQPERLSQYEYLNIQCPANAYKGYLDWDDHRSKTLVWHYSRLGIEFGGSWFDCGLRDYGSAIGFFS